MDYSEDEIIKLVEYNLGYTMTRFVMNIYNIRDRTSEKLYRIEIIFLKFFDEMKKERNINLLDMLEDTSILERIDKHEWRLRKKKIVPGSWTSNKNHYGKKIWYPDFVWNDIIALHLRDNSHKIDISKKIVNTQSEKIDISEFSRIKIKNFRKLWNDRNWTYISNASLARDADDWNEIQIAKWMKKMKKYHEVGVLDEWFRVTETISKIENQRGMNHIEDELMFGLRAILSPFLKDPINEETPSEEDIYWIFNELLNEIK